MHVRRVRLFGVYHLWREVPEVAIEDAGRGHFLITGAVGCGKTTILESIRLLWELFGFCIDQGSGVTSAWPQANSRDLALWTAIRKAHMAAVELGDFPKPGEFLWIGCGEASAWDDLRQQHPNTPIAGVVREGSETRIVLPVGDWRAFRQRSLSGEEPAPNVVSFPVERLAAFPQTQGPRLLDLATLNWSARFSADSDLDSILLTLKVYRPTEYEKALAVANTILKPRHKRLIGFSEGRGLLIEGRTERGTYRHPIANLSAGEREFVLVTAFLVGCLHQGGIVLFDEPLLAVTGYWLDWFLAELDQQVRMARRGQLLAVSDFLDVEGYFPREEERCNLTPWRPGEPR